LSEPRPVMTSVPFSSGIRGVREQGGGRILRGTQSGVTVDARARLVPTITGAQVKLLNAKGAASTFGRDALRCFR
jgi:hypothetical protein